MSLPLPRLKPRAARSLRASLALMIAAVLIPGLLFAGLLAWQYAESERTRLEQKALDVARSIAIAIDRELSSAVAAIEVLATSPHLQTGNFEGFHGSALQFQRRFGLTPVLRDRAGQQLINAHRSYGAPLPRLANFEPDRHVLETGTSVVSDLFVSPVTQERIFVVDTPVYSRDGVAYFLSLNFPVERIRQVILDQSPPADWVVAVIDRRGTILARNRGHEEFVGTEATPDLIANTSGQQGTWPGYTKEGTPVLGAYARTELSDWRVAAGVARSVINAPLHNSLWATAGVGLVLGLLSTALTIGVGAQITGAFRQLVRGAAAVGQGDIVDPAPTRIAEANKVAATLAVASREIRERKLADLRAADLGRRLQTIFESITDSVFVLDRDWRFTYINGRAKAQISGSRDLIGQDIWQAFPEAVGSIFWECYQGAMRTGEPGRCEAFFPPLGKWFEANAYPSQEGLTVYFRDVTERKQVQERQAMMVRELHHRVRNTLASVQAISRLTARSARTVDEFQAALTQRILSLSRTHTLLAERSWEQIALKDLIRGELAPYGGEERGGFELSGADVDLPSHLGLAIGMALHELTTNAAKHGALSQAGGRVSISWTIERADDDCILRLSWVEAGGPPVSAPTRQGFGSRLLRQTLSVQIKGQVDLSFAPEGLRATIEAPLGETS